MPQDPVGVDVSKDDLTFFPLLYWPMDPREKDLSPQALQKISDYMRTGGTVVFDTRDLTLGAVRGGRSRPAEQTLRRLISKLDLPPLEVVPSDHVLTKSFYILRDFPAAGTAARCGSKRCRPRIRSRKPHPRAAATASRRSSSAAMTGPRPGAVDAQGQPVVDVVPGGGRQREMAIPLRHQSGDVRADRQLQGRHGACARFASAHGAIVATTIDFAPHVPLIALWILIAISVLLTGFALVRRARGAWARGLALAMLILALANR